ncbi:MAG: DUF2975 domain-containing protein [Cytophagaceae bacterium]|nr:MAG: DUF2975 domain-containing protein [Cytophagaceae bacterium]
MITFPLARPLSRLFTYLFFGQIVLYILGTPILLFMANRHTGFSQGYMSPHGTLVMDSIQVSGEKIAALHDTTGTLSSFSAPGALTITSANLVDSVFRTNLDIDRIYTKDGYYVSRPIRGSSFSFSLPIGGRVVSAMMTHGASAGMPSDEHRNTIWFHRLSMDGPRIQVAEPFSRNDDELQINMNSWHDWLAIPRSLKLAILLSWLPAVFSILTTYQLMKLFGSMANEELFSELQLRRVNYIGYYALSYAFLRLVCDQYKVMAARQYIISLGYKEEYLFQTPLLSLTIEWSWLLMGLCILSLSQVFRYGMQLKQENELTI